MKFGVETFISTETARSGERAIDPVELARAVEERGFESLFIADHTHVPVDSLEYPGPESETIPNYFYSMLDPIVTLTAAAAATERLVLGTGVLLVPMRDPILTAKQVATLDVLSGGRFVMGIGAGWNAPEAASHGVDPKRRFGVMRERVEAMKAIWTQEVAEYHGKYVDFPPLYAWPKPAQRPHPPILIGGWADAVLRRIVDYGDGWFAPNLWPVSEVATTYARLCDMAAEAGRERPSLSVFLPEQRRDEIEEAAELKPDRAMFYTDPLPRDAMLRKLDTWAALTEGHE
ncbi:LLM class F420-dependent oxidoreductase [Actinomadura oligospora]|uniref:LLM class F420-dependent oxidoreductase n=1 Tax=Actinomadura oligospora TaxID=111804 RepID=UPI00047EBDEB|nr:LLM class F420-dependent oxidoreductase [Actinomadura oligospora]